MNIFLWLVLSGILPLAFAQNGQKYPVDSQSGRAIGAREISPEELKHSIGKDKVLVIDVREPDLFAKETIKGAINIPIDQLQSKLKSIPKDTTLYFT